MVYFRNEHNFYIYNITYTTDNRVGLLSWIFCKTLYIKVWVDRVIRKDNKNDIGSSGENKALWAYITCVLGLVCNTAKLSFLTENNED